MTVSVLYENIEMLADHMTVANAIIFIEALFDHYAESASFMIKPDKADEQEISNAECGQV
jgi:hypothetical protein